MHTELCCPC